MKTSNLITQMLTEHKLFKWVNIFVLDIFLKPKMVRLILCIDRWTLKIDASHTYAIKKCCLSCLWSVTQCLYNKNKIGWQMTVEWFSKNKTRLKTSLKTINILYNGQQNICIKKKMFFKRLILINCLAVFSEWIWTRKKSVLLMF